MEGHQQNPLSIILIQPIHKSVELQWPID